MEQEREQQAEPVVSQKESGLKNFLLQQRDSLDKQISDYKHDLESQAKLPSVEEIKIVDSDHVSTDRNQDQEPVPPLTYPEFATEFNGNVDGVQQVNLADSARIHLSTQRSAVDDVYSPIKPRHSMLPEDNISMVRGLQSSNGVSLIFEKEEGDDDQQESLSRDVGDTAGADLQQYNDNSMEAVDAYKMYDSSLKKQNNSVSTVLVTNNKIGSRQQALPIGKQQESSISPVTHNYLKYDSSFSKAESIVMHLAGANQQSVNEVDKAMAQLETQKVSIMRQVILVQLRRMLGLLEQIKMTQSQLDRNSSRDGTSAIPQQDQPNYMQEMVKTCAEAILIEVVSEETDPPSTTIRAALNKDQMDKIVYTWAEELEFEQICTGKVLDCIFDDFDRDNDGLVSEIDLRLHISNLISGQQHLQQQQAQGGEMLFGTDALSRVSHLGEAAKEELPLELEDTERVSRLEEAAKEELPLELNETENESQQVTERHTNQIQFESEDRQTGRTNSAEGHKTLLKLKNANSQELLKAIKDASGSTTEGSVVSERADQEPPTKEQLSYKDFVYVHEKEKLDQMAKDYHSTISVIEQTPSPPLPQRPSIAKTEQHRPNQSIGGISSSHYAVHPKDNSSEVEPEQPGVSHEIEQADDGVQQKQQVMTEKSERRQEQLSQNNSISYGGQTVKSMDDDREPSVPVIGSEFNSQLSNCSPAQKSTFEQQEHEFSTVQQQRSKADQFARINRKQFASELHSIEDYQDEQQQQQEKINNVTDFLDEPSKIKLYETQVLVHEVSKQSFAPIKTADFGISTPKEESPAEIGVRLANRNLRIDPIYENTNTHQSGTESAALDQDDLKRTREALTKALEKLDATKRAEMMVYVDSSETIHVIKGPHSRITTGRETNRSEEEQSHLQGLVKMPLIRNPHHHQTEFDSRNTSNVPNSQEDQDVKAQSKVSFSKYLTSDIPFAAVKSGTHVPFTEQEPDEILRLTQHQSLSNSYNLFGGPDPTKQRTLSTKSQAKEMIDQGTSPKSVKKINENQQHGSKHENDFNRTTDVLSMKSVQASATSEQLLPNTKVRRKEDKNTQGVQTEANHDEQATKPAATKTAATKTVTSKAHPQKVSKVKSERQQRHSSEAVIAEESEEKPPKKKARRRSKISKESSSLSPKPKKMIIPTKVNQKQLRKTGELHKTAGAGFTNRRKVDFSDIDELISVEAPRRSVEAFQKTKAPRRHRGKPGQREAGSSSVSAIKNQRKRSPLAESPLINDYKQSVLGGVKAPPRKGNSSIKKGNVNSSASPSPSRVYKTNAKNQLYQSAEMLPKELSNFSQKAQPRKLKPLDKRLAEARLNGLNASFQVENRSATILDESKVKGEEETTTLRGIDWGPDPEPVFSTVSNYNRSRMMSQENKSMESSLPENLLGSSIVGDYQPYDNFINSNIEGSRYDRQSGPGAEPSTAQMPVRARHSMTPGGVTDSGVPVTQNLAEFAALREEHHRSSMFHQRPSKAHLDVSPHLYIDETPSNIAFQQATRAYAQPKRQSPKNPLPWLPTSSNPNLTLQQAKGQKKQGSQNQPTPLFNPLQKRSMSNLTKNQIQGAIQKKQQIHGSVLGNHLDNLKRSVSTMGDSAGSAGDAVRQLGRRRSDELASIGEMDPPSQPVLSGQTMLFTRNNSNKGSNESAATPRKKKQGQQNNHNSTQEVLRTARRSQQFSGELLAVSQLDSTQPVAVLYKGQAADGEDKDGMTLPQVEQDRRNGLPDISSSAETKEALVSHSIDVANGGKYLMNDSGSSYDKNVSQTLTAVSRGMGTSQYSSHHVRKPSVNQLVKERAEKTYAAYNKKNVRTMYRSIENTRKQKIDQAYRGSKPRVDLSHDNLNQQQAAGSIDVFENPMKQPSDYDRSEEDNFVSVLQPLAVQLKRRGNQPFQPAGAGRAGSFPTLAAKQQKQKGGASQQYSVAQSHQKRVLDQQKTTQKLEQPRLQYPSKAQLRYHLNQDLVDIRNDMSLPTSPKVGGAGPLQRYHIVGQKSHSVLAFRNGPANQAAVSSSHNSLSRKSSKQFNLRDTSQDNTNVQIRNMFIHKGGKRVSPKGLPMDFDNRYTMEAFKQNNKPPQIAPLGIHGTFQSRVNNMTAKLNSNFDYKKFKQQKAQQQQMSAAANRGSGVSLRPVTIPEKVTLASSTIRVQDQDHF